MARGAVEARRDARHGLERRRARRRSPARALHIACPPGYMPRAALGALVAPLFVTLFRIGLMPEAHALLVARAGAARAPPRPVRARRSTGAREPGARARPQDRPHDPAHLRRRRARRGRGDALEVRRQREREGARVLGPAPRARPQRDLRLGPARRRHPPAVHARRAAPRLRARAARRRASTYVRGIIEECVAPGARRWRPKARAGSRSCSTSCTSATG